MTKKQLTSGLPARPAIIISARRGLEKPKIMSIFLETSRLILKTPVLADLDDLYLLQSDPDVMQYVGKGIRTKKEVLKGLTLSIDHQEKHGFSLGSVYEKESGQFVGRAGLIYLAFDDSQPLIEVGYALVKSAWQKGYATELTKALIDWGFQHLTVNKLIGVINPLNERSGRVLEKAGMHFSKSSKYNGLEVLFYEIDKPASK